jgi:hypothetical protein
MEQMKKPSPPRPVLRQTTLDGNAYVERDSLGRPVVRPVKRRTEDYILLVTGSRSINDDAWVFARLDTFVQGKRRGVMPMLLVHGDAIGVDKASGRWATEHAIPVKVYNVKTEGYVDKWPRKENGNAAYARRDQDMVDFADAVVALWDGESSGTRLTYEYAERHGKFEQLFAYTPTEPF